MPYKIKGNAEIANRLSAGLAINAPSWQTGKDYLVNDLFIDGNVLYLVTVNHTSTTSPTADIANLSQVTATVDLNTTISDQTGANGTGVTVPASAPASADIGDLHIEVYDDVTLYFTATATNWTAPAVNEFSRVTSPPLAEADQILTGSRVIDAPAGTDLTISTTDGTATTEVVHAGNEITIDVDSGGTDSASFGMTANEISASTLNGTDQSTVNIRPNEIDLVQSGGAEFKLNSVSSAAGQVPTGQGPNLPLVWSDKSNDRIFADDTTVAPASAGDPSEAEIATFAGANRDTIIYYTGNDTSTDAPTHVFHIDKSGNVTKLQSPNTVIPFADGISPAADDATGAIGVLSEAAREDHKHPAQAVSADGGNRITTGTDGLHFLADINATESNTGFVELATDAETLAGTDNSKAVHPQGLKVVADTKVDKTISTIDSDSGTLLVSYNAGNRELVSPSALKTIVLTGPPTDGVTTAYYIGQFVWDNINKKLYEAVTASTDPDAGATGSTFVEVSLGDSLTDVSATATSNNVDVAWNTHTRIVTAAASDTVTLAISTSASIGDIIEVYNASGNELALVIDGADAYLGSPSTIISSNSGFTARIVAANTIEVVGTGSGFTVNAINRLQVRNSTTQSLAPTLPANIIFDTDEFSQGSELSSGSTNNGISGLQSGKTYKIRVEIELSMADNRFPAFGLIATDGGGDTTLRTLNVGSSATSQARLTAQYIFTPTSITEIWVDPISSGGVNTVSTVANECVLTVEELPSSSVVFPDAVPVEDVKVLLGSGTGLANGSTITISDTWGNLASNYERVEFQMIGTAGSPLIPYRMEKTVETAGWVDDTAVIFLTDAVSFHRLTNMDIAGNTADVGITASDNSITQATINVYGVKAQKTVINSNDLVITNPSEADTTTVLQPNGDGTATFNASPSSSAGYQLWEFGRITGTALNVSRYIGQQSGTPDLWVDEGNSGVTYIGQTEGFNFPAGKYKIVYKSTNVFGSSLLLTAWRFGTLGAGDANGTLIRQFQTGAAWNSGNQTPYELTFWIEATASVNGGPWNSTAGVRDPGDSIVEIYKLD